MTTRRRLLVGLPGLLALGSGCTGILDDAKSWEAKPAKTDAASSAGYQLEGVEDLTVEREFAGQTVTVVNKVATYEKALSIPLLGEARLGVFATISTPAIEIANQTFNPVGDYDNDRLVGMLQSNYEGISDVREVSSQTVTVLGSDTEVTKYAGKAAFSGQQLDVNIHVGKVRHEADFVVCFGVYPTQLNEENNVLSMMAAAVHPA
ncbi:hypothetical protein SAMN04487950_4025 [Halogranum rubrum]|uniref:Lipoprotein LpqN n=1 Tax=Halogranum rubrum TaxID=553466 RepID=A0A1I4I9D5_9EURY|nr:DUF6517 family protein [Halogranum rubrum]SFL50336.1 hypothetical protein SAMN04487950_4025 [Halogranum rubrum]